MITSIYPMVTFNAKVNVSNGEQPFKYIQVKVTLQNLFVQLKDIGAVNVLKSIPLNKDKAINDYCLPTILSDKHLSFLKQLKQADAQIKIEICTGWKRDESDGCWSNYRTVSYDQLPDEQTITNNFCFDYYNVVQEILSMLPSIEATVACFESLYDKLAKEYAKINGFIVTAVSDHQNIAQYSILARDIAEIEPILTASTYTQQRITSIQKVN